MSSDHANPNATGYEQRLQFVHSLLENTLKLVPHDVEVIAYSAENPFPYNNFIFAVKVSGQIAVENRHGKQPGTEPIPEGCTKFILRLPNSASGYNNKIRVENEVAITSLARDALRRHLPDMVPRVFAWGSAADGKQGWILQEFMPGKSLQREFSEMTVESQKVVLDQLAEVLNCFQRYEIPSSIKGYGGLTYDETGEISIGPMSVWDCGPFENYEDLLVSVIRSKLAEADKIPRISGWRENGIRARLEKFLDSGVRQILRPATARQQRLVHADLSIDNLNYDPATMRLTAVLDFDFGHIGTIADDFFRSLGPGIGRFPDPRDGEETRPLGEAMLKGFPQPLPAPTDDIDWPAAKAWDDALREKQMSRPSNIPGIENLSEVFWLASQILPFKLTFDVVAKNSGPDRVRAWKRDGEESLDQFLRDYGF